MPKIYGDTIYWATLNKLAIQQACISNLKKQYPSSLLPDTHISRSPLTYEMTTEEPPLLEKVIRTPRLRFMQSSSIALVSASVEKWIPAGAKYGTLLIPSNAS